MLKRAIDLYCSVNPILSPTQNHGSHFRREIGSFDLSIQKDSTIMERESPPVRQLLERTTSDFRQLVSPAGACMTDKFTLNWRFIRSFIPTPFEPHFALPSEADPGPSTRLRLCTPRTLVRSTRKTLYNALEQKGDNFRYPTEGLSLTLLYEVAGYLKSASCSLALQYKYARLLQTSHSFPFSCSVTCQVLVCVCL